MKKYILAVCMCVLSLSFVNCAGMKVINPNDKNPNEGTKALDFSGGGIKIVDTYTCKLDAAGNRVSATGKTEEAARQEAIAKCHDHTMVSFCKPENVKCVKN